MEEVPLIAMHEALLENKLKDNSKKKTLDDDHDSDNHRSLAHTIDGKQGATNTVRDANKMQHNDWVYIEEAPEYMKCNIICCNVYEAPQLLTCCGKNVCKRCIESHIQKTTSSKHKPSCPHCRKEEFRLIPNTALELSINQLKVECLYQKNGCGWSGPLKHGKLHLKECKFVLIDCPNQCGYPKFERGKLLSHATMCPLQYINCPFQAVGCDSGALFLRMERRQGHHVVSNLHQHLLLIAQENARVSSECESNSTLRNAIYEQSIKESTDMICYQKQTLESLNLTIKSLGDSLQETRHKISSLKHIVAAERTCFADLEKNSKHSENTKASLMATTEAFQSLPMPKPIGIECAQPVRFTISNFRKRMAIDDVWLSPPFYTHIGGYKMCISVQPNGYGDAHRKHISAGIHFLMGEYDDYLVWPFRGAIITLTVIAQTQYAHSNTSTLFKLTGEDSKRVRSKQLDGGLGCGLKVSKVLDHRSALSYYLTRDCLELMVYHIQFLPL